MPLYNVTTTVEREVRADTAEEAMAIAEKLVLAMPHLDTRVCPTDPEVDTDAYELEETGDADAAARRRAVAGWPIPEGPVKDFLAGFAGRPYVAPGYNAPVDPGEPDVELVDLPGPDDEAQGYMADRASETDG